LDEGYEKRTKRGDNYDIVPQVVVGKLHTNDDVIENIDYNPHKALEMALAALVLPFNDQLAFRFTGQ